MSNYIYISLFFVLTISCNQSQTQVEKDYIRNLEEKNKILEKELQEMKGNSISKNTKGTKSQSENSKDFFTIGSTEDEVIEVMGQPTSYMVTAPKARKFRYGISTVYFYQGKVISYDNFEDNLKVRVKK